MAVIPKKFIDGVQLPNAAAASPGLYAAGTNEKLLIKKLTFTNTDASARQLMIHLVSSGGTASASNMLTSSTVVIPAGAVYEAFEAVGHLIAAGGFITAFSDVAGKVTCHGTGVLL